MWYGVGVARTLALVAWLVGGASLGVVMARERRPPSMRALLRNLTLPGWVLVAIGLATVVAVRPELANILQSSTVPPLTAVATGGAALLFPFWLEIFKRRSL
jgi:hypothetical protein